MIRLFCILIAVLCYNICMRYSSFFIFVFSLILSHPSLAQDKPDWSGKSVLHKGNLNERIQKRSAIANPQYEFHARNALREQPAQFDFSNFRRLYSQTRQYDPIGEDTLNRLSEITYNIEHAKDKEDYQRNMDRYQNLILNHMANLDVVMQASALAKRDKRYGDTQFFTWLKRGLIRNLMNSGDGMTLHGAFDIVTLGEEPILFRYLGMRSKSSKSSKEGFAYYNMHDAISLEDGKEYTIFVDTTYMMKFLEAKSNLTQSPTYDILKR